MKELETAATGRTRSKTRSKAKVAPSVVSGFVNITRQTPTRAYIRLICSNEKGLGTKLLEAAKKVAKKLGYKNLSLSSVSSAETFYLARGFFVSNEDVCKDKKPKFSTDGEDMVRMTTCLTTKNDAKGNMLKDAEKLKKAGLKFRQAMEEAYPIYRDLLKPLFKHDGPLQDFAFGLKDVSVFQDSGLQDVCELYDKGKVKAWDPAFSFK